MQGWASCWKGGACSFAAVKEKLHVETWAGCKQGPDLRISKEVEIVPGCAFTVSCPSCPSNTPVSPGPGSVVGNILGW